MKLRHSGLNPRFDMSIAFMVDYFFDGRRRHRRQRDALSDRLNKSQDEFKALLMIEFVNLKIKPTQFLKDAHIDSLCVHVFIGVSAHM
jgi:hypothetical protein